MKERVKRERMERRQAGLKSLGTFIKVWTLLKIMFLTNLAGRMKRWTNGWTDGVMADGKILDITAKPKAQLGSIKAEVFHSSSGCLILQGQWHSKGYTIRPSALSPLCAHLDDIEKVVSSIQYSSPALVTSCKHRHTHTLQVPPPNSTKVP